MTLYEVAVEYVRRMAALQTVAGAAKRMGVHKHHVEIVLAGGVSAKGEKRYVKLRDLERAVGPDGTAELLRALLEIVEETEGKRRPRRKGRAVPVPESAGLADEGTARELGASERPSKASEDDEDAPPPESHGLPLK